MKVIFRRRGRALIRLMLSALFLAGAVASAEDWPKDYIVEDGSESPDHHYGVLIPGRELAGGGLTDYLADLKAHRVLGELKGAEYFEGQNHASLGMVWAYDSTWGVLELDGHWDVEKVWVVEPGGGKFAMQEIGGRIRQAFMTAVGKEHRGEECETQLFHRANEGRILLVNGIMRTNPRDSEHQKTVCGYFQGRYDAKARKWTAAEGRSITVRDEAALGYALNYATGDAARESGGNREAGDRANMLDEKLNLIYQALKFLLPPARFAPVKQEQVKWLKKRDAMQGDEKMKLVEDRIEELANLLPF